MSVINKKGSVLVITVVVTVVLIAVGLTFTRIIEKEILRQSYTKRSISAFAIADSALECFLYNDFRKNTFAFLDELSGNYVPRLGCSNNSSLELNNIKIIDERTGSILRSSLSTGGVEFKFELVDLSVKGNIKPCADVRIIKTCAKTTGSNCYKDSELIGRDSVITEVFIVGYDECEVEDDDIPKDDGRGDIRRLYRLKY